MKRTSIREDSQLPGVVGVMVIATLYFARVVFSPVACWPSSYWSWSIKGLNVSLFSGNTD